jgi:hypothetical protein
MSNNLVICLSRGILFYPLAYVLEFGKGREFDFIIANEQKLPEKTLEYLRSLGVTVIDLESAKKKCYDSIFLQPYQDFHLHQKFLNNFKFKNISYYSDALRNGMYSLVGIDKRAVEFIYFGFELIEQTFVENLDASQLKIPRTVVNFESIRRIWIELGQVMELDSTSDFLKPDDLLIVMRHWGQAPMYPIREEEKLEDYIWNEMQKWPKSKRVIIKPHPFLEHDKSIYETLKFRLQESWGSALYFWDDLFPVPNNFPELGSPEYVLWAGNQNLGNFFAFDGSLNNLVALASSSTSIQYPDPAIFGNLFENGLITNLVSEQIAWQKKFARELINQPKPRNIVIETSGVPYEKIISKMSLLAQQKGSLKREERFYSSISRALKPIQTFSTFIEKLKVKFL